MPPAAEGTTRGRPTVLLAAAALLLVARVVIGIQEGRHPPTMPDLVDWRPIEDAERVARERNVSVLYDFTAEWCVPCQIMQREVFADPERADEINRWFVPVRVVDRTREEGRNAPVVDSLQKRYGVSSFPTLVVVPSSGDPMVIVGYEGKHQTIQRLRAARMQNILPPMLRPPSGTTRTR